MAHSDVFIKPFAQLWSVFMYRIQQQINTYKFRLPSASDSCELDKQKANMFFFFFFGSAEADWSDFGQTNNPKKIYEILCWPKELNSRNKVFGIHKTANLLSFYFACSP